MSYCVIWLTLLFALTKEEKAILISSKVITRFVLDTCKDSLEIRPKSFSRAREL
jgi:hypothetical protein